MDDDEMEHLMTDADFELALDALHEDGDAEVGDLLRAMNENRIISWEEAERILCDASNEPIKSSLPQQTRPTEPDNDTDVDQSIRRLLQNDPKLVEINLNNMKRTPIPQIKRILEAIRENTCLEKISLANMGLYDTDVAPLIEALEDNETLRAVNVETNYLSGEFFARLLRAALKNQTLEEIKGVNQGVAFSTTAEHEIIDAIFQNRGLTKVSINLRLPEGRHKVEQATIRNLEIRRILRRQAAAEARAAEEAAAAKAARMGDISPARISTVGKPPTKKQLAMQNGPSTSELKPTAPMINPKRVDNLELPRSSAIAKRANALIATVNPDFVRVPGSPKSFAPMILASPMEKGLSDSDGSAQSPTSKSRPRRSITTSITSGDKYDDESSVNSPTGFSTKSKPPVRKLSTEIETMYTKSTNNEGKVAFIPEAPVGRASLIAKKFEKKEAHARKEIERNTRRLSATKTPSNFTFNVAAVVPNSSTEVNESKETENKKGELSMLKDVYKKNDDENLKASGAGEKTHPDNTSSTQKSKEPSKWRQKMDEMARKKLESNGNDKINVRDEPPSFTKSVGDGSKADVNGEPRRKQLEKSSKLDLVKSKLEDKAVKSEKGRSGEKFAEPSLRRRLQKSETVDEGRGAKSLPISRIARTASKDDGGIDEASTGRTRKIFAKLNDISENVVSKPLAVAAQATNSVIDSKPSLKTMNAIKERSGITQTVNAKEGPAVKSKAHNENVELATSSSHSDENVVNNSSKLLPDDKKGGSKLEELPCATNMSVTPKLRRKKLLSENNVKTKDILPNELRTPKSSRKKLNSENVDVDTKKSDNNIKIDGKEKEISSHNEISRPKFSRQKTATAEPTQHSSVAEIFESKKAVHDTKPGNENQSAQKPNLIDSQTSTVPASNAKFLRQKTTTAEPREHSSESKKSIHDTKSANESLSAQKPQTSTIPASSEAQSAEHKDEKKEDAYVYVPLTTRPKRRYN